MMRVELLPGMTNVVRFPVERRAGPTMGLLRDIAPDVREVLCLAEAFGMEPRGPFLGELAATAAQRAVAACRDAHDAASAASNAQKTLLAARTAGSFWTGQMEEKAEALTGRAAVLLLTAHAEAEQAEGVARAVDLARQGEHWSPRDGNADMEFLIAVHRAAG